MKNYAVISEFLAPSEIAELQVFCQNTFNDPYEPSIPYFNQGSLVRVERFAETLDVSISFPLVERSKVVLENHFHKKLKLFKDKINFRLPGSPGFGAHQDAAAGWTKYGEIFYSILVFVRDSAPANGGFEFGEFSNSTFIENINGEISERDFELLPRTSLVCRAGEAVIFDSYAPHRSFANGTDETVPHLILTFGEFASGVDIRSSYYSDKTKALSPLVGGVGREFRLFEFKRN